MLDVLYTNAGLFQGLALWGTAACTATICYRKANR